jgi:hypothetical protein
MWTKDTHGDFTTVIYRADGGFRFYPYNIELTQVFLDTWREMEHKTICGAV